MQRELFPISTASTTIEQETIKLDSAGNCFLELYRQFFSAEDGHLFYQELSSGLEWSQDQLQIGGRQIPIPRLQCWVGDAEANYGYSGIQLTPRPFTDLLHLIKERVEFASQCEFNSVLANLYRDGQDSVGWHSDDEPELGANPKIASVSLGGTRRFGLKPKTGSSGLVHIDLHNGDLLIMAGKTQHYWRHQIAKTRKPSKPRINLTFRKIWTKSSK